jgi:hypothetical protein
MTVLQIGADVLEDPLASFLMVYPDTFASKNFSFKSATKVHNKSITNTI